MAFAKTCAAILALALFVQSGCDLWCQHAERTTSVDPMQDGGVPPCHQPQSGNDNSDSKHSGGSPEHNNCVHPQAADDNSKLQAKVIKAEQSIAIIETPHTFRQTDFDYVVPSGASPGLIRQSGPLTAILRI
jgi:hypothetical protein